MTAAWPMHGVKLVEPNGWTRDEWTGYLVPGYLGGLPNEDARAPFSLEYECGTVWLVPPGDLLDQVWKALMIHDQWCMAR